MRVQAVERKIWADQNSNARKRRARNLEPSGRPGFGRAGSWGPLPLWPWGDELSSGRRQVVALAWAAGVFRVCHRQPARGDGRAQVVVQKARAVRQPQPGPECLR